MAILREYEYEGAYRADSVEIDRKVEFSVEHDEKGSILTIWLRTEDDETSADVLLDISEMDRMLDCINASFPEAD